jgi:5'-deoxynucleotidase
MVSDMSHFFAHVYRLRYIQRWPLMRNAVTEDTAQHTYHVAVLTHALCTIGREVFGRQVDPGQAVILALFHDVEEVLTGDIAAPIKHHDAEVLGALRQIEALAAQRLLAMVPDNLLPTYQPLIGEADRDPELIHWVKAADTLDALLKCRVELAMGNREFAVAARQLETKVRSLGMPEVDYFLEHFGPSFERSVDELEE